MLKIFYGISRSHFGSLALALVINLMVQIDGIPCHPENKLVLYICFLLSKISWHFIIANHGKIW